MVKDAMIQRLGAEPALCGLDEGELLELLKVMDEAVLPAERVLTWEDTPVWEFGIVLSGSLGVHWGTKRINQIAAGGRFGVDELRDTKTWKYALVTECETRILVGAVAAFPALAVSSPSIAALFGAPTPLSSPASGGRRWGWLRTRRAVTG